MQRVHRARRAMQRPADIDAMNDRRIPADPERVNTHSDEEAAYWCNEFDCTRDELREAVSAVGETAQDVRLHLSQRRH